MPPVTPQDLQDTKSFAEAADLLKVSDRTLRRIVAAGDLEVLHVGSGRGRPRFTTRALLEYANGRRQAATKPPAKPKPAPRPPDDVPPPVPLRRRPGRKG